MMKFLKNIKKQHMLPLATRDDTEALKSFALGFSIAVSIIFIGLLPWLFSSKVPLWPAYIAIGLGVLYLFAPRLLYYPYVVWMTIASFLGFFNTYLVLALAYYLLIVPIGLVMQWLKGLQYTHKSSADSTWIPREKAPQKENLKEPF